MRTGWKLLAGAAGALLAGAALTGAVFLLRPGALLDSRTAGAALRYFGAAGSPRWSRLSFSAEAFAHRRHRYVFSAADLCGGDRKGVFSGCFSELTLSMVVFYSWRGPVVERIESLVAVSRGARLDLRRLEPGRAPLGVPAALRSASVEALRVELDRFIIISSKTSVSGGVRAALTPGSRRPLSIGTDLLFRGPDGSRRLQAGLTADTDLLQGGSPSFVDVIGRADMGALGRARTAFHLRREALRYIISGTADVAVSTGAVRAIRLTACRGSAPLDAGTLRPSGAELSCRYELVTAQRASPRWGGVRAAKGGVSLSGRLDGERFEAALLADLAPVQAWMGLTGTLAVRVNGRRDLPLSNATMSHELHAAAGAPRFEDLVPRMRGTRYAIPAPINVLKGPLSLTLDSRGDPRAAVQTVRYAFSSDLAGRRQRLALRATGELIIAALPTPDRSFELNGEMVLKEVALELPRLDLGRVPEVVFDKRIKPVASTPAPPDTGGSSAARSGGLPLRARILVKTGKPLLLFSNLIKDPVPVGLDLIATHPPPAVTGTVSLQKFDVALFRRNATVDHLNIALSPGSKAGALEGLVRYKTPQVAVSILVLGTTKKPRIEFTSVPPMKREAIIALLIFGKSPGELDAQQTASVGNTQTALESRAFGLASLYLFGATPVEHVGYDSATKTASVKLRLPGGTNLELDSDFDRNRELRLRKLLAPHWAIQSEVTEQGSQNAAGATFLEWFNRY